MTALAQMRLYLYAEGYTRDLRFTYGDVWRKDGWRIVLRTCGCHDGRVDMAVWSPTGFERAVNDVGLADVIGAAA